MPYLSVQSQRLHYGEHREDLQHQRIPLVLVHGAGMNMMNWPPSLRRLPDHDIYALDLPGHGRSQGPGRDSIGAYVEVLSAWATAMQLPAFVLAGHSMGGAIALQFALRYPSRLAGLVLVATDARLRVAPAILANVRTEPSLVAAQLVEWVHGPRAGQEQKRQYLRHLQAVDLDVFYGDWVACNAFDVREQLPDCQTPTLILAGTLDVMTPPRAATYLAEHIAGADLTWFEGAGHMLMLEQPETVIGAMVGFMDRLRRVS